MRNESDISCRRSTWNQQNNSSIDFQACLGMDFGFMLDLEYADLHKTLESDMAPPKAITIAIATSQMISDVKDFDGNSHDGPNWIKQNQPEKCREFSAKWMVARGCTWLHIVCTCTILHLSPCELPLKPPRNPVGRRIEARKTRAKFSGPILRRGGAASKCGPGGTQWRIWKSANMFRILIECYAAEGMETVFPLIKVPTDIASQSFLVQDISWPWCIMYIIRLKKALIAQVLKLYTNMWTGVFGDAWCTMFCIFSGRSGATVWLFIRAGNLQSWRSPCSLEV